MVRSKIISEGAESHIYFGKLFGLDLIIKYRHEKRYLTRELDLLLRSQRTKTEARLLAAARLHGVSVPAVLFVMKHTLYIEKINGKTLHEMPNESAAALKNIFEHAGRYLAQLHSLDIAHGDYTPANIMVDGRGKVWIIDFGLALQTSSLEDKALDLLLMKRSISESSFRTFISSYSANYAENSATLTRLAEIERRGRYQVRTLLANQS